MARSPARGALQVRIPDSVAGLVRTLHPRLKQKIRAALTDLASKPHSGKGLQGELSGLWSYRVGPFRIIYRLSGGQRIEVVAVGPRERIYEETYRLVRSRST